ncbi:hypothetical protein SCHPADRAFT_945460 [Schizopora paradoxa]|uniref:BTB domain-containing protein n=1 Tax=Schizopora paradoxa TaxID=27342 RepID=A0A0H2RQW8_9AGAM|nr:hypothetical protein SCHPADRAFT_945460 [Schizopora paradoxa]
MPPKRRRLSETTDPKDGGGPKASSARPHDDIWYSDGSVVLATDTHLYRVHKSMLAKHSKVLKDLFEIPTAGVEADRWEDVPLVRMAGDSDEEVCVLLKALYGMNLKDVLRTMALSKATALLSISSKYDFNEIRRDVIAHLASLFPSTFEKYKASDYHTQTPCAESLFNLIVVAHRCEVQIILPVLYYLCATFPLVTTVHMLPTLPTDFMKNFLLGRDWLCGVSQRIVQYSSPAVRIMDRFRVCRVARCVDKFRDALSELLKEYTWHILFVFDFPENGILNGVDPELHGICGGCATHYRNMLDSIKEDAWNQLPFKFLGKKWEELK